MLGAIIGDIAGSRFEWIDHKSKKFELFTEDNCPTDDSIMTLAVAAALLEEKEDYDKLSRIAAESMQSLGNRYPDAGYGGRFYEWLSMDDPQPYNSFGNGSAMRVSPCGWAGETLEEVKALANAVTRVTHDHPEGLKGAEAVAVAIYLLRTGSSRMQVKEHILLNYYDIDFKLDDIRPGYKFDVTCQGSVPQAFEAFFEAEDFEDCIRNAISIGGDSDTIAAIAGSMAEAYFGIPKKLREQALDYLDELQLDVIEQFEAKYSRGEIK